MWCFFQSPGVANQSAIGFFAATACADHAVIFFPQRPPAQIYLPSVKPEGAQIIAGARHGDGAEDAVAFAAGHYAEIVGSCPELLLLRCFNLIETLLEIY